ncbi:YdcF family protein [Methyloversatilis sp.]|uniref:YdcF family protein n=1 Tax=Methyloversatilis sp. TaxID=2569862 RepID=UPI0027360C84|nr:YdcF family protein [Methyloversatilis sp.]MDP2867420.1 YdcF family protein [Methyloversatilis sp.]MDP3286714.1 YdcF family protein [Methyloversatilis sp.]MDP3457547.1 YdcF family protein [Methyloversatilis sp.]MDP3578126.1 YdcF family protein [Methyloversatilis sp.]
MLASLLFALKKLLSTLLLPPVSPLLASTLGLLLRGRHPRTGAVLAWSGLIALWLLATPVVSGWLERSTYATNAVADLSDAQAIVILGAGSSDNLVDYDGQTVNGLALERLRAGARLARQTGLPLLVSGGVVWQGQPEADMMAAVLQEQGVAVRWIESASRDTGDNAALSAVALGRDGITRVALVTHAFHMRRAMEHFRRAGLTPLAAPTLIRRDGGVSPGDLVPTMRALSQSWVALHEWLGWIAMSLRLA